MKALKDPATKANATALTDAQLKHSTYLAVLLAFLLPPFIGGSLMGLVGYYPLPEFYFIFFSYTGVYVFAVVSGFTLMVPRMVGYIIGLTQMERTTAQASAKYFFGRLPWILFCTVTLYSVIGALSADYSLEAMGVRNYTLRDHLNNQFGLIPVVLITVFPIFFYYIDRLGRYLGPRGVIVTAASLWIKLLLLGLVTPVLIDSLLIGYYINLTGIFTGETLSLWLSLIALAAGGTWLAWHSLRQGISPLETFIASRSGTIPEHARLYPVPLSLDEMGVLTARFADMLSAQQKLSGDLYRTEFLANSLIDNAGVLVVVLDANGRIVRFNRACERLSGYTFAEVWGKCPWDTVLPPEQAESVRNDAFEALAGNAQALSGQYTNQWVSKTGQRHLIDWYNTQLLDDDGKMEFLVSVGTDVTERRQIEEENIRLAERLNEAQRIAQVGNWELDLASGHLSWSDEIFNLFEIDKARFGATYEAFLNSIHPDDRDMVNQAYTNSLATRASYEVTHRLLMNDGRIKWVQERCYSEFENDGKPLRSVGTVQDITQMHLVQVELESFRDTLERVLDAVFLFDTEVLQFTYVNRGALDQLGYTRDELLAMHPYDIAPEFAELGFRELIQPLLRGEQEALRFETIHHHKNGRNIPVEIFLQYVVPAGGAPRFVAIVHNITQRKNNEAVLHRLNEDLEQRVEERTALLLAAKEEAEQASRAKSLFLASMSHELRTPLNAILGYAQLTQIEPGLPGHVVENAHEIKRAGDFLLALMNDLLDLARIESGRMEIQITTFDLAEVVKECHAQNNAMAAVRNIVLACDENRGPLRVRADRHRVLQVLNNLVSNAIKYNRDGGKVGISCNETAGGRIRISVKDSGIGITPEQQAHLFEPFSRLGAEMGTIEGAGIGLVMARGLLEYMDGRIGVESTPGTGSVFWVELPADEASVAGIRSGTMQEPAPEKEKFRVLVAEDYTANQVVLRLQLQTLGYKTDVVCNGAEALDKWRASRYHLILTDLDMPVMDGLAFARTVRAEERSRGSHIPIIAITAAAVRDEMSLCRAAGIDDALAKPISLDGLKDMLSRWLENVPLAKPEVPMMPASPERAILDTGQLYRILGKTDRKLLQELVATFLISARNGLDVLDTRSKDAEAVSREMHKLKSSAKTVGAMRFAQLAEALEKQTKLDGTAGFGSYLTGLREALNQIEAEMPALRMDTPTNVTGSHPVAETPIAACRSVLVVDDDVVVLQHMKGLLATLGVQQVLTAMNGLEAVKLVSSHGSELEVLICDLNMPEMDGVELIRNFGKTGFKGGLVLMSGADENVLSTVSRLAGLQGLRVLGQAHKPVMPEQIAKLLAHPVAGSANIRKMASVQQVSREEIIAGMASNEFSVWFQPKVEAVSLKPAGFEALARWQRPGGQFVPTDTFITMAEQNGIIGELSKLLVIVALKEGSKLFAAGFPFKIAINLSGRWLDDLNLPEFIHENTIRAGLRAEDVILEVTETGVMEDLTTALDVLTRLRLKGFGLSIDDFGIGYSSFEQLGRIPFTELKLDRSFVNKGTSDPAARAILEGSMDMARKLKLSSVAEGVETQAELELIRSLGCERVQGYLIAKPMHRDDLLAWLRSR